APLILVLRICFARYSSRNTHDELAGTLTYEEMAEGLRPSHLPYSVIQHSRMLLLFI
ncbi:unnamed protein product, partial [marine sediment metagenome]